MTEYVCKICNKACKDAHNLVTHVKIHNMSSKQYYDTYLLKPRENLCKTCGNITRYVNLTIGYKKHCNMSCTQHDPEIAKKYKESFKKRDYAAIAEKMRQTLLKKNNGVLVSEETKAKKRKTAIEHYGGVGFASKVLQNKYYKPQMIEKYRSRQSI